MAAKHFDLALVDIKMPGTDGVELQRRMHEIDPEMLVIIMTGYASVETAVAALKNGAYDYVSKPFDPDDIAHTVHNALSHKRVEQENARLRETVASVVRPQEIVGQSAAMVRVFEAIQTVGPTDATVLITGESGTGKELSPAPFMLPARVTTTHWWSFTAAHWPKHFWKANCSATKKAHLPARNTAKREALKWPTAVRFSSMKLATSA